MNAPFRLYGAELSPFSIKVRAFLRFKSLDFSWLARSVARQEEFARYAKLPLIPVLVDSAEEALQDSTLILEKLEAEFPEPSLTPDDPALAFLAALLEDYADEWLNKAMFHYRWTYPADQISAARRLKETMFEGAEAPAGVEEAIRTRMSGRLHHVGSSADTAPVIEASFARLIDLLDLHLAGRAYLFGGRPCLADFGLYGQLAQLLSDPTPGAMIEAKAPRVAAWVARMEAPRVEGPFEPLDAMRSTLSALLKLEIAGVYLPWMAANAHAVAADASGVTAELAGHGFTQKPQRYAAKALAALQRKRALADDAGLAAFLAETGCDGFLSAAPDEESDDGDEGAGED